MTDHGSNMELFSQLDCMSFCCPVQDWWFWEHEIWTTARRVKTARFTCVFYKTYSNFLFSTAFFTFRVKLNWSLQAQLYKKKYVYIFDPFTLKSYGFSWSTSIHLCSVSIVPDPSIYRICEAELLSRQTTKKKKKKSYLKIHSLSIIQRKHLLQRTIAVKSYSRSYKFGLIMVDFKVILWKASN